MHRGRRQHLVRLATEQHVRRLANVLKVLRPGGRVQMRQVIVPGDVAQLVQPEGDAVRPSNKRCELMGEQFSRDYSPFQPEALDLLVEETFRYLPGAAEQLPGHGCRVVSNTIGGHTTKNEHTHTKCSARAQGSRF